MAREDDVRLTPVGELTEQTLAAFLFELDEAVITGCVVTVDLTDVTTIGPAALEALVEAHRYLRDRDCTLRLEHPKPHVAALLEALAFPNVAPGTEES